jgi:hypothetical protein
MRRPTGSRHDKPNPYHTVQQQLLQAHLPPRMHRLGRRYRQVSLRVPSLLPIHDRPSKPSLLPTNQTPIPPKQNKILVLLPLRVLQHFQQRVLLQGRAPLHEAPL